MSAPDVPTWSPSFKQPTERVVERFRHYMPDVGSFVVFENGTCVPVARGLSEVAAFDVAKDVLHQIVTKRPDLHPHKVEDGAVFIGFKPPAYTMVLSDIARAHWQEIERRHQEWVLPNEVLMTPMGPNVFDDYGKQVLLARAYMFLDARDPAPVRYVQA